MATRTAKSWVESALTLALQIVHQTIGFTLDEVAVVLFGSARRKEPGCGAALFLVLIALQEEHRHAHEQVESGGHGRWKGCATLPTGRTARGLVYTMASCTDARQWLIHALDQGTRAAQPLSMMLSPTRQERV